MTITYRELLEKNRFEGKELPVKEFIKRLKKNYDYKDDDDMEIYKAYYHKVFDMIIKELKKSKPKNVDPIMINKITTQKTIQRFIDERDDDEAWDDDFEDLMDEIFK